MNEIPQKIVSQWWADMSLEYFEALVSHFKNVTFHILKLQLETPGQAIAGRTAIKFNIHLRTALIMLKILFKINKFQRDMPVPFETFYIHELIDFVQIQNDFCGYKSSKNVIVTFITSYLQLHNLY